MWLLPKKIKYLQTLAIYMAGTLSLNPFQISKSFSQFWSTIPGIACRSLVRFQLRRQLQRAITFNSCIVGKIREYRCVRLIESFVLVVSIHWSDLRFAVNWRISPRLRRGSSCLVSFPIVVHIATISHDKMKATRRTFRSFKTSRSSKLD
jgi:hypothetical protein